MIDKIKEVRKYLKLANDLLKEMEAGNFTLGEKTKKKRCSASCIIEGISRDEIARLLGEVLKKHWDENLMRYNIMSTTMSIAVISSFIANCFVELYIMPECFNATDFMNLVNSVSPCGEAEIRSLQRNIKVTDKKLSVRDKSFLATFNLLMQEIKADEYVKTLLPK